MSKFIFIFLLIMCRSVHAQQITSASSADTSTVIIHKDPRIDLLMKKQAEINEETSREARRGNKGFRLMIITTPNRQEALNARARLYQFFPELKAYLWHQSPYYKLKAGNFRERKDAEAYQKKMNKHFPRGVFIIPDTIEIKPEKDSEQKLPQQ
jgi:hypothetical protein